MQVRFIHSADWQLGMTRHFLSPEAQGEFTGDRIETIRSLGALASQVGAEFMVVAGDVFETNHLPSKVVLQSLDAMADAKIPIYLLPGNHDPLEPGSIYTQDEFLRNQPDNVQVLDRLGVFPISPGLELVAAPWFTKRPDVNPVTEALDNLVADGTTRILVGHGMLDELQPDRDSLTTIHRADLEEPLASGLIHYVALGDRHIRWPDDDSGSIHYSGTHEATDYAEKTRGTALEVFLDDGVVEVTCHEVGKWLFSLREFYLDSDAAIDQLAADLSSLSNANRTILKLTLKGGVSISQKARLDQILADQEHRFGALEYWARHSDLVVLPSENEFDGVSKESYLGKAIAELSEAAADHDEVAASALQLLKQLMLQQGVAK